MSKNNIIPQMFDVRPVDETGTLDWEKIEKIAENYPHRKTKIKPSVPRTPKIFILGQKFESHTFPIFSAPAETRHENKVEKEYVLRKQKVSKNYGKKIRKAFIVSREKFQNGILRSANIIFWPFRFLAASIKSFHKFSAKLFRKVAYIIKKIIAWPISFLDSLADFSQTLFPKRRRFAFSLFGSFASFSAACFVIISAVGAAAYWNQGLFIKGKVLGVSQEGYASMNAALASFKDQNFDGSVANFNKANLKFSEASEELDKMGNFLIESSRFLPFVSQLSSGKNAMEAGKYLASAGEELVKTAKIADAFKESKDLENVSLLDLFREAEKSLEGAGGNLQKANDAVAKVNVDDLPNDKKEKFVLLKTNLPTALSAVEIFRENEHILNDLLGGNGPRKYLFLFQNNQEMRPTGGFIGSYGLLDIANGHIRKFFIDGIFNPDGQLQEKVVPPLPIQKISAAWSLHDSNWFPDFPTSAKEAIVFYEKTGGPTADGVITLTPTVLEKLLEITGPIEMKDYDVVLDSHNFIEKTQYEVEEDYDKTENKPKKILADLAPLLLDKLFSTRDLGMLAKTLDVFVEALDQKQILIYSQNEELQKMISNEGWSGEVLPARGDYLSVINTNINGFKTDGVISEKIEHQAEIQSDGSVVDTVVITRHHNGGNTGFDWWDKVNADYMRIYVPLGSKFLGVEGQTRESDSSPLDYEALGFRKDPRVEKEEAGMAIDEATGTRIYDDSGKTVFANWTYVSPQETMTIKYRYELPFKISFDGTDKVAEGYSLLAQKQAGSLGSEFYSSISFPSKFKVNWKYPEDLQQSENELQWKTDLARDRFWGAIFTEKNLIINQRND